jgi:hypothetical protein
MRRGERASTSRGSVAPPEAARASSILVEDAIATRAALSGAGIEVSDERDVLVVDIEDRPGTMGEVAPDRGGRCEHRAGLHAFGAVRLLLGVDDLDKARAAL